MDNIENNKNNENNKNKVMSMFFYGVYNDCIDYNSNIENKNRIKLDCQKYYDKYIYYSKKI